MSGIVVLTEAERRRFALWLQQQAESARAIARQVASMPGSAAMGVLSKRFESEGAAMLIVASKLLATEDDSIRD